MEDRARSGSGFEEHFIKKLMIQAEKGEDFKGESRLIPYSEQLRLLLPHTEASLDLKLTKKNQEINQRRKLVMKN